MQIVSAYLLAASAVDSGNYDEDYDIDIDPSFEEYMDIAGDEVVGDYIELQVPTDGGAGNFDGTKFCADWISAFARPIEYFKIYANKVPQISVIIEENSTLWAGWTYQGVNIARYLDNSLVNTYGKHINMWFATISHVPLFNQVTVKMWGCYVGRNLSWKCVSNQPARGFVSFSITDYIGADIGIGETDEYFNLYDQTTGVWAYPSVQHNEREGTFILVYNVTAFKAYLNTMQTEELRGFLISHTFVLGECNVSKSKA